MDDQSQLLHWLKQKQEEGRSDSEGVFTLTQERAWGKLASFQLPFAEAWAIKLVQAAVALGAGEIAIYQTWQATSIIMRGMPGLNHEDLVDAVLGWDRSPSAGLAHMSTAVRVLGKGLQRPFSIDYGDGRSQVWVGERFVEKTVSAREDGSLNFTVFHFGFETNPWQVSSDTMKSVIVNLSQAIVKHCYPCPIPLKLDGRTINGIFSDPDFGLSHETRPLGGLTVRDPALPDISFSWGERFRNCPSSDLQVRLDLPKGLVNEKSFGALAVLSANLVSDNYGRATTELIRRPRRGRIVWIQDGAVVQREELDVPGRVSLSLLLGAEGLETDLTGFQLRATDAYRQRKAQALVALTPQLEKLCQELPGTVRVFSEHPFELLKRLAWMVGMAVLAGKATGGTGGKRQAQAREIEEAVAEVCRGVISYGAS